MYGLEEYYNELLTEAKSPEEIKQILVRKYVDGRGVPMEILDRVFEIDPTKKKTYTSWLLNFWITDAYSIQENLDNGKIRLLFYYFKSRNNEGLNLIAIPSLQEAIDMLPEIDTTLEKMSNGGPEDDFDIVYDTPEWKIAVPHSYPASEKLGKGCKWCTAGWWEGRGPFYYSHYTAQGPLWINFDFSTPQEDKLHKQHQFTRYQFLFEYDNYRGEFMNYNDERVDPARIPTMPMAVKEFYVSQNPRYRNAIMGGDAVQTRRQNRHDEYLQERLQDALELKQFANGVKLLLIQELNRNSDELNPNLPYHVYISEDTNDPITHDCFEKNMNIIVDACGTYPMIILRSQVANNGTVDLVFLKLTHGFEALPINTIEIKNQQDYIIVLKKSGNNYNEVIETLISCENDNKFAVIAPKIKCLGKERKVLSVFRNKSIETEPGINYIEIVLDNGFHQLFKKTGDVYSFAWSNKPYGEEKFSLRNGVIRGKFGIYNPRLNFNYTTFELISENFAIVKKNTADPCYNIFDGLRGCLISEHWFFGVLNLFTDNLVLAKTERVFENILLISLNNGKSETIHDLTTKTVGFRKYYSGKVFNDTIEIQFPLSCQGIKFMVETPEQDQIVKNFVGESTSAMNEQFNNFYKRMTKK